MYALTDARVTGYRLGTMVELLAHLVPSMLDGATIESVECHGHPALRIVAGTEVYLIHQFNGRP